MKIVNQSQTKEVCRAIRAKETARKQFELSRLFLMKATRRLQDLEAHAYYAGKEANNV